MRSSSILCSSNSLSPSFSRSITHRFPAPLLNRCSSSSSSSSSSDALSISTSCSARVLLNRSPSYPSTLGPVRSAAVEEIVETKKVEQEFIQVGYICSVHGLQGEVKVKPSTDFPELRFSTPGKRWLRQQISGRERLQEVELVEGRGYHGRKGWIVKFNEIDTVDQAQLLIGSTVLVTQEDKPELDEGDYYSRDLVGMRVILKETVEPVGTVVNVFNSGASDLLQVKLNWPTSGPVESEPVALGPLVWVPFVKAIVPIVDMKKREMFITPPKGLLELNIRSDERSKKERRALEWKERKKFQRRLIAAKKKLCEMEQQHVFHGFRHGEKAQTSLLADQIVSVNSKLLQQALQNFKVQFQRWNLQEFIDANLINCATRLRISEEQISNSGFGDTVNAMSDLKEKGRCLLSKGKVAIVLYVNDEIADDSQSMLGAIFSKPPSPLKVGDRAFVPLVLVCPSHEMQSLQNAFTSHNHFDFDSDKVWFLEEQKLPVVGTSAEEQNKHRILMKSPWEILQTPVGSGGVISLLSSENLVENLSNMGVEYVEVFSINQKLLYGDSLIGLVSSSEANLGFQICKDINYHDDNFNMVFSINFMKYLTKRMKELPFQAIPKLHAHVEKVEKGWVDLVPSSHNSYEFHSSIYSCLSVCPPNKICMMEV